MTHDELSKLPDADIDRMVALNVMRWVRIGDDWHDQAGQVWREPHTLFTNHGQAMLLLLAEVEWRGWYWLIEVRTEWRAGGNPPYQCRICGVEHESISGASADTITRAACFAALLAVGVEKAKT